MGSTYDPCPCPFPPAPSHVTTANDIAALKKILTPAHRRTGSSFDFQIAAVDMMPCVLYIVGVPPQLPA